MADEFFSSFNASIPDAEKLFTEDWTLSRTNQTYPAIAIDRDSLTSKAMSGGKYIDAQTTIYVRKAIFDQSGVKKGDIVIARSHRYAVTEIDQDGDDARTLLCGPVSIDAWK